MKIVKSGKGGKLCCILQGVEIHSNYDISNPGLFVPSFMHQSLDSLSFCGYFKGTFSLLLPSNITFSYLGE